MATSTKTSTRGDRLRIDFLFLDLETCTRCRGTDRSLEEALEVVRDALSAAGIEVEIVKIHVTSAGRDPARGPGGTAVERAADGEAYELPEELKRFFAGREGADAAAETAAEQPAQPACCSPAEQRSCCDPEDKAACCGGSGEEGCACR